MRAPQVSILINCHLAVFGKEALVLLLTTERLLSLSEHKATGKAILYPRRRSLTFCILSPLGSHISPFNFFLLFSSHVTFIRYIVFLFSLSFLSLFSFPWVWGIFFFSLVSFNKVLFLPQAFAAVSLLCSH